MNPCVCGHWHAATCPHCGCVDYAPDDGTDGPIDPDGELWTGYQHAYRYEAAQAASEGLSL